MLRLTSWLLVSALLLLASGCELVADFDRSKLAPEKPDATVQPVPDAAADEDASAPDEEDASAPGDEEDAGR